MHVAPGGHQTADHDDGHDDGHEHQRRRTTDEHRRRAGPWRRGARRAPQPECGQAQRQDGDRRDVGQVARLGADHRADHLGPAGRHQEVGQQCVAAQQQPAASGAGPSAPQPDGQPGEHQPGEQDGHQGSVGPADRRVVAGPPPRSAEQHGRQGAPEHLPGEVARDRGVDLLLDHLRHLRGVVAGVRRRHQAQRHGRRPRPGERLAHPAHRPTPGEPADQQRREQDQHQRGLDVRREADDQHRARRGEPAQPPGPQVGHPGGHAAPEDRLQGQLVERGRPPHRRGQGQRRGEVDGQEAEHGRSSAEEDHQGDQARQPGDRRGDQGGGRRHGPALLARCRDHPRERPSQRHQLGVERLQQVGGGAGGQRVAGEPVVVGVEPRAVERPGTGQRHQGDHEQPHDPHGVTTGVPRSLHPTHRVSVAQRGGREGFVANATKTFAVE